MLPFAGSQLPTSADGLCTAIKSGLAQHGVNARDVHVETGAWPKIDRLAVDVTGARVTRDLRLPEGHTTGAEQLRIVRIDVSGTPLFFETAPLALTVAVNDAALGLAQAADGSSLLTLAHAAHGTVVIEARHSDLQAFAHSIVSAAAAQQGVQISSTTLQLVSRGPRALTFRVEVTAKMFVMSARATVTGDLAVDDQLNAHLSHLTCTGDGMIATAATAFLRPQLARLEQRVIPLLALPLGEVKLRDVSLAAGETVRIEARFSA